jgi:hypothetical protein
LPESKTQSFGSRVLFLAEPCLMISLGVMSDQLYGKAPGLVKPEACAIHASLIILSP